MNVSSIGQPMAMDGRSFYPSTNQVKPQVNVQQQQAVNSKVSAEVAQTLSQNLEKTKESVQKLQQLSDITMGRKLQFNVNDNLGKVVISVVDSKTNQVIKQIPSEEVVKMQERINKVMGLLFDEMI